MNLADRIELCARRALDDRPSADKARGWYTDAREFCAELARSYDVSTRTVVGVIAALSPMQVWDDQLVWAPRILQAWKIGQPIPGPGFSSNKAKARRILEGEYPHDVLRGDKVRAFYACILGDQEAVCIDRHAQAVAWGPGAPRLTAKRYRDTARAYREVGARLDIPPAELQALCWVWHRANR